MTITFNHLPNTFHTTTSPTAFLSSTSSSHITISSSKITFTPGTSDNYILVSNSCTDIDGVIDNVDFKNVIKNYLNNDVGLDIKLRHLKVKKGWTVETPDNTIISIDDNGNIEIKDDEAKIIYKANRIREFNRYLNASDLLEEFIHFVGTLGAKQHEVLTIPIELFINWLIIEASKFDGEEPPALPVSNPKILNRCLCCGRFITKASAQLAKFCNPDHYSVYLTKQVVSTNV